MNARTEGVHVFAAMHDTEPEIELALEPVDDCGIKTGKPALVEQPIKPVLTMYQEMQRPGVTKRYQAAFSASPKQLGRAAVAGARKRSRG